MSGLAECHLGVDVAEVLDLASTGALTRMRKPNVLIVEDVPSLAESYAAFLAREPVNVDIAHDGKSALALLERKPVAILIVDVRLPDMSGLEILENLKAMGTTAEVIVITAEGSVQLAVEAMRLGAYDFVIKPFSRDRLCITVRNALEKHALSDRLAEATEEIATKRVGRFIGESPVMQGVYRVIKSAAASDATVFVTGDSGTGKELAAEALHGLSKRRKGPFIVVNCAAIPKDLLESEIFGHVKGAFTGATADREGAALQANGGTLFLDEVGEMNLDLQAKMLRFLQNKTVQRVGESKPRPADVRIVCATNRDPQAEVAAGRFREDLFYRLHVVPLEMPALRERDQDILLIAQSFLEEFCKRDEKGFKRFSPRVEAVFLSYPWPGNVRQLQNVVRSVVVLNDGDEVTLEMLPREFTAAQAEVVSTEAQKSSALEAPSQVTATSPAVVVSEKITPLEDVIKATIERAIELSEGSIPRAAAALNVSPSTLYRRIQGWQSP